MEITNPSLRLIPADPSSLTARQSSTLAGELFASRNLLEVVVRQAARTDSSTTHHRPNDQRGETWRITLQAGDRQFSVLANQKLTPGQTLQLQRLDNGQLQIVGTDARSPTPPPPPTNPEWTRRILDGLQERNAIQQPPERMIRLLMSLLGQSAPAGLPGAGADPIPAELAARVRRLIDTLPGSAQMQTRSGVQAAILESGLMLETRLRSAAEQLRNASTGTGIQQELKRDFKAVLLELQQTLVSLARARLDGEAKPGQSTSREVLERALLGLGRPAHSSAGATTASSPAGSGMQAYLGKQLPFVFSLFPTTTGGTLSLQAPAPGSSMDLALSTLLRQTAATLARIELQQLHTIARQQGLGSEPAGSNALVLELPVRHGDAVHVFQLVIEEEERDQAAQETSEKATREWKLSLRFELEPMGPMCAEVGLIKQALSACFWAERASTSSIVRDQLQDLRARLEQCGLEVTELDCRTGMPPQPQTRFERRLVDIRT